jgi:hypothetical protein
VSGAGAGSPRNRSRSPGDVSVISEPSGFGLTTM